MALVEIEQLTYAYGGAENTPRLKGCSLSVEQGEMVLLVGASGCGKSTLLRAVNGLVPHFYGGTLSGSVSVAGLDTRQTKPPELAHVVACVFQDPEAQIVSSTVFEEVVFGLESLGVPAAAIALRAHESLSVMGISHLAERSTRDLSGGEIQRVALAAALATRPALLVLDEPTSQLDPASAEGLLELLRRVNEDSGVTVLLAEHRLDRCFHWADRVVVMADGEIVSDARPRESACWSLASGSAFVPPVTRLFEGAGCASIPLTVKEGRAELRRLTSDRSGAPAYGAGTGPSVAESGLAVRGVAPEAPAAAPGTRPPVLVVRELRYTFPNGVEALRGCTLTVSQGECVSIMGDNGAGKSTLVRHFNGLIPGRPGAVSLLGRDIAGVPVERVAAQCGLLGQNPNDYLFCDTVAEELRFSLANLKPEMGRDAQNAAIRTTLASLGIEALAEEHPRAISAGQRQRVAIGAMTVAEPALLVLDEPTRGLDWESKATLGRYVRSLRERGTTAIVVTHDVEFAAAFTDRTIVMGGGRILAGGATAELLSSTAFLAPQVSRVRGEFGRGVVTVEAGRERLREVLARG